jgi:Fe-S cluster assembly protein SufD
MKVLNRIATDFDSTINDADEVVKNIRIENFNEFKESGIPTSKQEFWKYTDPSIVKDSEFSLGASTEINDDNFDIIIVNGKLVKKIEHIMNTDVQNGFSSNLLENNYFDKTTNPFINLNNAFLTDGCVINFNNESKEDIRILNVVNNTKSEQIIHPRIIIKAGKNSNITIFEEVRFLGEMKNLVNSVTNFYLEEGANVEHVMVDDFSENTYQISNILVEQKKDSTFSSYNYSNAKNLARKDIIVELKDRGSHCDLRGVYLADNDNHIDHHTIIEHEKEHCTSNELYKGILSGKSTGVFNGRIHVHNEAQKTDAIQSNQNILLSDNAIIHTKPELEIYADDVKCTHGATVGQLDEKGIFYLRARGIKRKEAQKMMMRAYVGEVLSGIKNDSTRDNLLEKIIQNIPDGD